MTLSAVYPALALLPVISLLAGILVLKWSVARVGAVSWILAILIAHSFFGAGPRLLALANCKGLSMAIYVILIIWSSIFLYNIADSAGAIYIVGHKIQGISDDRLTQFILFDCAVLTRYGGKYSREPKPFLDRSLEEFSVPFIE